MSLVDILPRGGEAEGGEGEGEKEAEGGGGGGGGGNAVLDKLNLILDAVRQDYDEKFPGKRYNVEEVKETVGKDRRPWQNVLIMELE